MSPLRRSLIGTILHLTSKRYHDCQLLVMIYFFLCFLVSFSRITVDVTEPIVLQNVNSVNVVETIAEAAAADTNRSSETIVTTVSPDNIEQVNANTAPTQVIDDTPTPAKTSGDEANGMDDAGESEPANTNHTKLELNLTVDENQIPVFSEWAQKRMEEVEKQVEQDVVNSSAMKKNGAPVMTKTPVLKLKSAKNYASPDCGAKIIASNSESSGTGHVLSSNKDEYLLSPCKSRIWFVVELCEAIQAERIELANFELFSSSPKNFSVGVSNRFPTRDWTNVGRFVAKDERYVQNFDLHPHLFGKYVRVDIHSHYNSEHFCPISLFRVYGTSEFEAFETENRQHPEEDIDDDEDDDVESVGKEKSNIFKSASDAVISIVKKTASFLNPKENKTNVESEVLSSIQATTDFTNCRSPNFISTCIKCTENFTQDMNLLLQCKHTFLTKLLSIDFVRNNLFGSQLCANLVGPLQVNCREQLNNNASFFDGEQSKFVQHLFPLKYIAAMCNLLAATERKISWNSTIPLNLQDMKNITIEKKTKERLLEKRQKARSESQTDKIPIPLDGEVIAEQTTEKMTATDDVKGASTDEASSVETAKEITASESNSNAEQIDVENSQQNIFNVGETGAEVASQQQVHLESQREETGNNQTENVVETIQTQGSNVAIADTNNSTDDQAIDNQMASQQFGQKLHSESVFLRLSNRVKVCNIERHSIKLKKILKFRFLFRRHSNEICHCLDNIWRN